MKKNSLHYPFSRLLLPNLGQVKAVIKDLKFYPAVYCLLLLAGPACRQVEPAENQDLASSAGKSELVNQLEGIFYSGTFADLPDRTFNAADFGAAGDGQIIDTEAIQQTIDAAATAGGGKVIFPEGTYLTGALFVKSNVELHLGAGVTLKAIPHNSHYPDLWTRIAGIEMTWPAAIINVYEQKKVRITGEGVIDGNGKYWWDKFWGDPPRSGGMWVNYTEQDIRWAVDYDCKRVRPVVIYKSSDVLLKDFTVKRAGFWTISLTFSERVHVDGLVIRNNIGGYGPSSDGINTDSSRDILVENCDIDCNDDNLCIKSGRDADGLRVNRPAENIVYRNCITRAGHGLFTIGSETSGGMRNIEVYGLKAIGTNMGIRFKSAKVRGGLVENVWFHDISMEQVNNPFHFELNWYPQYSYPKIPDALANNDMPIHWKILTQPVEPPEKGIPEFRNLRLSNITVSGAEQAFYANAYPEKPIHGLVWENITIEAEKGGTLNYAQDWTMKQVTVKTRTDQPLTLENSSGIDVPDWIPNAGHGSEIAPAENMENLIAEMRSGDPGVSVFPVNLMEQTLIEAGDTTTFSEKTTVYVLSQEQQQIRYYEPLGDGFYFAPVTISIIDNGIRVSGERNHLWQFRIKLPAEPASVSGADEWAYDATRQYLNVEKEGMQFEFSYAAP